MICLKPQFIGFIERLTKVAITNFGQTVLIGDYENK